MRYFLRESTLPNMKGTFCGSVHSRPVFQKEIVDHMANDRGSTVTKTDIIAVLQLLWEAIRYYHLAGRTIIMDIFCLIPTIKGIFQNDDDQFDAKRHRIRRCFSPGRNWNTIKASDYELVKVYKDDRNPFIDHVFDFRSRRYNKTLTPGDEARICGYELKFPLDDSLSGIFLIPERKKIKEITKKGTDGTEYMVTKYAPRKEVKVPDINIHVLTEGQILFRIPDSLKPGTYSLEIRKRYGKEILRSTVKDGFIVGKISNPKSASPVVVNMNS
jgi:hypothetical protein